MRAQLIELVAATLGRAPSPEELTNWLADLEGGTELSAIAEEIMFDLGGVGRIAGVNNTAILVNAYQNLFGRLPDNSGLNYWLNEMNAGRVDLGNLIPSLLAGARAETGNSNDALVINGRLLAATQYLDGLDGDDSYSPSAAAAAVSAITRGSVADSAEEPSDLYNPDAGQPDPAEPAAPTVQAVTGDDFINEDEATAGFAVSGTGEPGATIEITKNGQPFGVVTVDENGNWTTAIAPGFITNADEGVDIPFELLQKDASGNEIGTESTTITIDLTDPAAPAVALNTDTAAADGITSNPQMDVTNLEAGATWEYSVDGGNNWTAGAGSSFNLATETTYNAGDIQVRQTDEAGNLSTVGQSGGAITYDATAPALNGAVVINDGGDGLDNGETIVFTFNEEITSFGVVGGAISHDGGVLSGGGTTLTFTSDGVTTTGNITLTGVVDVAGNTANFDETIA
ncbi:MAG: Ig-like domain-containing protein [Pseudomonadales bacterium]|nr:Ig-like domain-containing protein [Pseudomonadales bacterium]